MKSKTKLQKNISGFKPELHWKMIVVGSLLLAVSAMGYDAYLYIYARDQISKAVVISVATSTDDVSNLANLKSYTSATQMGELFDVYKKREVEYNTSIDTLSVSNLANATSTVASSTIATSSKQ